MAMSKEDVIEEMEEFSVVIATKFDSLKEFTFKRLRETELKVRTFDERLSKVEEYITELNLKGDIEMLDDSLKSLRSDFEKFRSTSSGSVASQEGTVKGRMDTSSPIVFRESPSVFPKPNIHLRQMDTTSDKENPMIKKQRTLSVGLTLSKKTQEAKSTPPHLLDDIQDASLKSDLERYYTPKLSPSEKLTPVQHAFVQFFLLEKKSGFSAKRSVVQELIKCGVKNGLWTETYEPAGIKNTFHDYLREKIKNLQKKCLSEKSLQEFVDEYSCAVKDD